MSLQMSKFKRYRTGSINSPENLFITVRRRNYFKLFYLLLQSSKSPSTNNQFGGGVNVRLRGMLRDYRGLNIEGQIALTCKTGGGDWQRQRRHGSWVMQTFFFGAKELSCGTWWNRNKIWEGLPVGKMLFSLSENTATLGKKRKNSVRKR